MNAERTCPKCGTTLSDSTLTGLCLKCLGRLGFGFAPDGTAETNGGASVPKLAFGDYELLEEIARGGMGVVYKARQLSLDRTVAVKMVLHGPFSSAEFVRRFQTEAKAAAGLRHPNIVAIYEVGERDGQHFFSMEYIEGKSFADLVRDKPLPANRAAGYVKSVAEAMHYAHGKGVLHRDLKPSNVLLDIFDQPRVTDFGLAKLVHSDSQLTLTGQALGSPEHMPPEQAAGKPSTTPQGDIYSLGAILYHLITGRPPFQGETLQQVLLQAQTSEPIPPRRLNPGIPLALQTICLKCLRKDPAARYTSAQALADDLGRFLRNEPIHARPTPIAQRAWLWCRRHPIPALLSAGLVLTISLGLAGVLSQWRRAEASARNVRLNLYAADVNLASRAFQRGDYGLARRTLAALAPAHGEDDLRGFEWRYLWNLCRGDQLAALTGHTWIVTCTAFSPDGHLLATGSQDGSARVWRVPDGAPVATLPATTGAVWSVAFTPQDGLLMTAGYRGSVRFWNTNTWQPVMGFPGEIAVLAGAKPLMAVSESSPLYWERIGKVTLWDYRTREKLREFDHPGRALALSPDAGLLAVVGANRDVFLWDTATGKLLRTLPTTAPVWSLTFAPAGNRLVSVGWSEEGLVWDLSCTNPPAKLKGHAKTIWSAAFSPDGSTLVTASSDQSLRFWDPATLMTTGVLRGHDSEVWCVAFRPDGQMLASGGKDQTVRLWPSRPPPVLPVLSNDKNIRPVLSPVGDRIELSNPTPGGNAEVWDLASHQRIADVPGGFANGFSPDGTQFLRPNPAEASLDRWSPPDHAISRTRLEGLEPGHASFARTGFSPGWHTFFALDNAGALRLWNAADGTPLARLKVPPPPVRAIVLGPQAKYLALSREADNLVLLYDTRAGRELRLAGHRDFVSGLAFSPDAAVLATGSVDGTIRLWATATGQHLGLLPGHVEEATDVAFSPDGRTLASLGRKDSLKLWHLPTRRELISVDFPHAGEYLQFSADGRRLVATTDDHALCVFEAP